MRIAIFRFVRLLVFLLGNRQIRFQSDHRLGRSSPEFNQHYTATSQQRVMEMKSNKREHFVVNLNALFCDCDCDRVINQSDESGERQRERAKANTHEISQLNWNITVK